MPLVKKLPQEQPSFKGLIDLKESASSSKYTAKKVNRQGQE
jgi:hypothetical protein